MPVVVDVAGANGAHFVSELTLGNRGTTDASVTVTFTAADALGSTGSGTFTTAVPAGRQLVFADALQWLRQNGLFIPLGDEGGTLRLAYSGLSSGDVGVRVRADARRAARRPRGPRVSGALAERDCSTRPSRSTACARTPSFRSNLALLNAGDPATGERA